MRTLLLTLLLSTSTLSTADHTRGHPAQYLIVEVPGTSTNDVDCSKMANSTTDGGYTFTILYSCYYAASAFTVNGKTFSAGRHYNIWIRSP